MKLTLALDYSTLKPLGFLINKANVSESKIFLKILSKFFINSFLKINRLIKPATTKGKTAKSMKPAMVIKIILIESSRLAKNRPARIPPKSFSRNGGRKTQRSMKV